MRFLLHICTFKTATKWAVMSERGDADCEFQMRSGVKKYIVIVYIVIIKLYVL
uniref:Uncharacterized protein n=1 Tax=viral metagenome TaxID=1070528 RepID=A0A6C0H2J8_9ZZZZ